MIIPSQLNAIKTLLPSQLSGYLMSQGWIEDGDLGEIATIWHRKENEYQDFEILQPLTTDLKDYCQRVYDLIEVLSEFEQRAFFDVVNDLNNFHADVIKIKVIHDDVVGGSIPLNDGVLLFEKAKELLISVVRSTYNKRKYFSGDRSPGITEFIESMRLGQTEYGSYVINLIAPISHKEEGQQELPKVSVSRLVSETLTRSLSAIDGSIKEYIHTGRNSSFDRAVEQGVSANLCDALIGISGETRSRDVKITISLSRAEGELDSARLEHHFASDMVPYLQIASDYYKEENYVLLDQIVSGLVTKLSHEKEKNVGTVTIDATVDGVKKSVNIELPNNEYWQSHSAHKKLQIVECLGDLHVAPRSAKLVNVKDFRVISNEDLFDSE